MKKKRASKSISIEIDKLTNSIESRITGEFFDTEFHRLFKADKKQVKKSDWYYDWQTEMGINNREVYKLTVAGDKENIQGMLSISVENDHVFVNFVESAKFNQGKDKSHLGVGGNMFAFACKRAKEEKLDGVVAFKAKTKLIEHYKNSLGARHITRERMYIDAINAELLINKYFKT